MCRYAARLLGPVRNHKAPPDGGCFAWLSVASAFLTYCLCVGVQYSTGILLSAIILDSSIVGGGGISEATWAASLMSSMFLFGSLPAGVLVRRVGARAVMLLGCALFAGGAALAAAAGSLAGVRAGFFLLGLGCSLPSSVVLTEVQRWFLRLRGTASGIVVAGSGVGAVVLAPLVQAQIDAGGWRGGLRFLGALAVALLPLCAAATVPIVFPDDAVGNGEGGAREAAARQREEEVDAAALREWGTGTAAAARMALEAPQEQSSPPPPPPPPPPPQEQQQQQQRQQHTFWALCRHQPLQCLLFYVALYGGAWFVLINHLNNSFRESGTGADAAALLVSLQGAANTAGRLLMGVAADVLQKRGVSKLALLQTSVGVCGCATALLACPPLLRALPYQALYYFLNGMFGGSIVSLQAPIVVDLVGIAALPPAFGLLHAVQAPLVLLLPPLFGALRAVVGWPVVWALVGAQILAAVSCVSFMREPERGGGPLTLGVLRGACRGWSGGEPPPAPNTPQPSA